MTFTYTEDLSVPRDFVRFNTGDVVEAQSFLSDEAITSILANSASKEAAVIMALRFIMVRLSQPNFKADWLQVDNSAARVGYENILREKQREFGLSGIVQNTRTTYREDSAQIEAPNYENGRGPGGEWDEKYPTDPRYW